MNQENSLNYKQSPWYQPNAQYIHYLVFNEQETNHGQPLPQNYENNAPHPNHEKNPSSIFTSLADSTQ